MALISVNTVKETSSNDVRSVRNVINTATWNNADTIMCPYRVVSIRVYPVSWALT